MGRIRTIKPEFPQSESVGKLSRDARLLFIQLWTIADDEGRARAASRMLASLLYPYDDDAPKLIGEWLDELEFAGMVRRYVVDGNAYLEIVKWLDHQKIDRPSKSRLPEFVEGSRGLANAREPSTTDLGPRTKDQDQDHSRAIEDRPDRASEPEQIDLEDAIKAAKAKPASSRFDEFWQAYPRRDGPNPRKPAETKFNALVKSGCDPEVMIAAAKKLASEETARGNIGTRFIPQAITWLNQQRWADHAAVAALAAIEPPEVTIERAVEMFARIKIWSRHAGPEPGLLGCRASPELLAKYGLAPDGRKLPPREAA